MDEDTSDSGFLKRGHSKDIHSELPLVSIAFAVTQLGIPIRFRIDTAKIASESLLDGKFLVSTSSMKMDGADVLAGYKQLWAIERVFRDMKNILDIRPVYHHLDDRIRSYILLVTVEQLQSMCYNKNGGSMKNNEYEIHAFWDKEASVWVAESTDVKGLVTEADTFEELREKLQRMIPELLEANGIETEEYIAYRVTTDFHETIPA